MDDKRFKVLEQLNAQVDVWIDQEEFDSVINAFKCSPSDKETDSNSKKSFNEHLENAFSHDYCTFRNEEWDELFNLSSFPLVEFRFPGNEWVPFSKDDPELEDKWAQFFWAKLIRAKIQQKGSDCYFNKLDQLIVFLERNQPVVKRNFNKTNKSPDQSNKLSVIYLLEMAAAGVEADQRSFAERARRILRERFIGDKCFCDFYDILARYNIGLGHQHEGHNREAVWEFNGIIKKLRNIWNEKGKLRATDKWAQYVDKRYGLEYLYLPAILGRAGIEIKRQLAYHALDTIKKYWKEMPQYHYLTARKEHLFAEANRLMGKYKLSNANLNKVADFLFKNCRTSPPLELSTTWEDRFEKINTVCEQKWGNIRGRLLDTYVSLHLDELKEKKNKADSSESLKSIYDIFSMYWKASEWQATDRTGYFELVAAYLAWIAKNIPGDNATIAEEFKTVAMGIYKDNQRLLTPEKPNNEVNHSEDQGFCFTCSNLRIKLDRLGSSHYQEFVKNMREFYDTFKMETEEDSNRFRKQIFDVEKDQREDSAYQKRNMAMDQIGDDEGVRKDWCKKCIQIEKKSSGSPSPFSGLLKCVDSHEKASTLRAFCPWLLNFHDREKDNQPEQGRALPLDSKHYEHLMDNWDRRFLKHLESVSVHSPRCKALHILGLQRWNSASPAIGQSLGGGYLIYHTDENGTVDLGVAVDPGFDFIRNLFHVGFSLSDIDVVLLSHAHLDHIRDFESLVTLCLELKNRGKSKCKKLHAIMTLAVYHRLSHIFESPGLREFVEPYILDIEKEIEPEFIKPYIKDLEYYKASPKSTSDDRQEFIFHKKSDESKYPCSRLMIENPSEKTNNNKGLRLSIAATRAYHNDHAEYSDSFGFKIAFSEGSKSIRTIGYTGDTSWSHDIIGQYQDCNALLIHIGSLIGREKHRLFANYKEDGGKCWDLIKRKNHPYLFGLLQFLTEIAGPEFTGKVPLVLLSEFGEELRGRIRLDLHNRLSKHYNGTDGLSEIHLLPIDVGLDVVLFIDELKDKSKDERDCHRLRKLLKENEPFSFLVKCVVCEEFIVPRQVDFETYGHDEAFYCVCKACRRSTPQNVLQDKLRDLYEVARPLHPSYEI